MSVDVQAGHVEIACDGGAMGGYLARPPAGKGPGIVLLQEIFGVNAAIRAKCDDLAREGFLVLAPDMFWRITPGLDLGYSEPERQEGFRHLTVFDQAQGIADIGAAWHALKARPDCTAPPALVGFCIGGRMAVRAGAALPDASAIFAFYGVKLDEITDELDAIERPLRLYFGDQDSHVPVEVAQNLKARLAPKPTADVQIYTGAGHGFFNPVRQAVYDDRAAQSSRTDMLAVLRDVAG